MGEDLEPGTKNQSYSYRNLILWQKSQDLTLRIIKAVAQFPHDSAAQIIARQIIGAASSIGANIAEGHERFSLPAPRIIFLSPRAPLARLTGGSISFAEPGTLTPSPNSICTLPARRSFAC